MSPTHRRIYVQHSGLTVGEKMSSFLPCTALQVTVGEKGFNDLVALEMIRNLEAISTSG